MLRETCMMLARRLYGVVQYPTNDLRQPSVAGVCVLSFFILVRQGCARYWSKQMVCSALYNGHTRTVLLRIDHAAAFAPCI